MFNNVAIEVALGLAFIFLLYGMLASILQEILAKWFGLRARTLLKGLRRMLQDDESRHNLTFVDFFCDIGQNVKDYFQPLKKNTLLHAFYQNPTIKSLGENRSNSKPSYFDGATFSKAMIQILRGEGYDQSLSQMQMIRSNITTGIIDRFTIDEQTQRQLSKLWIDSNNDIERFRSGLEEWFNNTMDRATGWYKKQTQLLLFLIGFGLAYGFNVDAIAIAKILAGNDTIRKEMANLVINQHKKYGELVKYQKDSVKVDAQTGEKVIIKVATLNDVELEGLITDLKTDVLSTQQILGLGPRERMNCEIKGKYQNDDCVALVGWLLTALAISLGAPFWFDLLNKIMLLRGTGFKPVEKGSLPGSTQLSPPIKPVG